jgi:hypothetical protein
MELNDPAPRDYFVIQESDEGINCSIPLTLRQAVRTSTSARGVKSYVVKVLAFVDLRNADK